MNDNKFYAKNQNVYKQYTGAASRVMTDLVCIATSDYEALRIVAAFTASHEILRIKNDNLDTQLHNIKCIALDATS
jgi:hypothetical protein